jgi:hypothetical protein
MAAAGIKRRSGIGGGSAAINNERKKSNEEMKYRKKNNDNESEENESNGEISKLVSAEKAAMNGVMARHQRNGEASANG